MKSILISSIIDGRSYPDAGCMLYDSILSGVESSDKVTLDFTGVSSVPSMFLNVSFGRLISEKGVAFIKEKISFCNITVSQVQRIKEYVNRYDN